MKKIKDEESLPAMPIMADGSVLREGLVGIETWRHALTVQVAQPAPAAG